MFESSLDDTGFSVGSAVAGMFFIRPGIIEKVYPEKNRVDARVAIMAKYPTDDGSVKYDKLPLILNVPLVIPYAQTAGLAVTLPIREKDPCVLLFSDRMLDLFLRKGEIALPEQPIGTLHVTEPRQHDMTDAICFPGIITNNFILPDWNRDAIEIRDKERKLFVSVNISDKSITATDDKATATLKNGEIKAVAPSGWEATDEEARIIIKDGRVRISAPNGFYVDAPNVKIDWDGSFINGDVRATNVNAMDDVTTAEGFSANEHVHEDVEPGGGLSGTFAK